MNIVVFMLHLYVLRIINFNMIYTTCSITKLKDFHHITTKSMYPENNDLR